MPDRISREVARHYERWPFPGGDFATAEGLLLLWTLTSLLPGRGAARRGGGGPALRVLDAGCGTGNTAIALARALPHVAFTGVDRSRRALAAARRTARARGLPNVDFRPADLALPAAEPAAFDVVLSLGVVHHMADRGAALIRLREWLAPGGRILLWVYGRHGRHAHNLNQRFLRAVTRGREAPARHTAARAFVRELGGRFAAGSGFTTPRGCGADGLAYLLDRPQWLADQMIPAHEEPFDLPELFAHLAAAGLRCERWLGVPETLAELTDSRELLRGFARLSARERMLALDCLLKPDHYFLLVRPAARRATRRAASCASARPTKTGARR